MVVILVASILVTGYAQNIMQEIKQNPGTVQKESTVKNKITFIEPGLVHCIPCQQMQLVMKQIREKYANQANVVFYKE